MCYVCFFNGHNTARLSFVENQRRIERVIIELYSTFTSSPTFVEHLSKFKNFHSCKQAGFKSKRFRYWIWRTRWHKVIFFPLIFLIRRREIYGRPSGHCNYSNHPSKSKLLIFLLLFNKSYCCVSKILKKLLVRS